MEKAEAAETRVPSGGSMRHEAAPVTKVAEAMKLVSENIRRVIVGKDEAIELVMVALLCEGHILIEDVPGTGKTTLARAIARSLGAAFSRIQFTPDLMPSDVTGVYYFDQATSRFEFRPGPIMANIVLADEINRATPRTQSCLLEAMQERQVTVDTVTHPLPRPFMVLATQNPVELEGTFPLPEAQLDRFLLKVTLGYPSEQEEAAIIQRFEKDNPLQTLEPVMGGEELLGLQRLSREVFVEESVRHYVLSIARSTRSHPAVSLGASPRAAMNLYGACQALAAVRGRSFVIPDDAKRLALPVLAHRLLLRTEAALKGRSRDSVVSEVLDSVAVPVE